MALGRRKLSMLAFETVDSDDDDRLQTDNFIFSFTRTNSIIEH
jgi:hypothetical protein